MAPNSITPKERVRTAFSHKAPDHVPYNMVLLEESEKKLRQAWRPKEVRSGSRITVPA